jgi:hypothetical protein
MIKKSLFIQCGLFNEAYTNCFEDVELNLKTILLGYTNLCDSTLVAHHYESQTRNEDSENFNKLQFDFKNTLAPFINNNIEKLAKHIVKL